jgi:hypothetical protein
MGRAIPVQATQESRQEVTAPPAVAARAASGDAKLADAIQEGRAHGTRHKKTIEQIPAVRPVPGWTAAEEAQAHMSRASFETRFGREAYASGWPSSSDTPTRREHWVASWEATKTTIWWDWQERKAHARALAALFKPTSDQATLAEDWRNRHENWRQFKQHVVGIVRPASVTPVHVHVDPAPSRHLTHSIRVNDRHWKQQHYRTDFDTARRIRAIRSAGELEREVKNGLKAGTIVKAN